MNAHKPILPAMLPTLFLAASFFGGTGAAQAASVVASEPVGFLKATIPAASVQAPARIGMGLPFTRPSVYFGQVVTAGSSSFKAQAPNWTGAQFTKTPHFVKIRSGAGAGRTFLISANTGDTLSVDAEGQSLDALAPPETSFEIFPAHTLESTFGGVSTAVRLQTGATEAEGDVVRMLGGTQWSSYFHDGTSWRKTGSKDVQNNVVIRPEQGVFLVSKSNRGLDVPLGGVVSVKPELTPIPGTGDAFVAMRFPLANTLAGLQIQGLPGWKTAAAASQADKVMLWNGASWNIYYHTGANWEQVGSFANQNTAPVPVGGAFLLRRVGSTGASLLPSAVPFAYP